MLVKYNFSGLKSYELRSFPFIFDDSSIEAIFPPEDNYLSIINGKLIAENINDGWKGDLTQINPLSGYWITAKEGDQVLNITGLEIENPQYFLHTGSNLVSYPFINEELHITSAFDNYTLPYIKAVVGENLISINVNGSWYGSLEYFEPQKGYWIITSALISPFKWIDPSRTRPNLNNFTKFNFDLPEITPDTDLDEMVESMVIQLNAIGITVIFGETILGDLNGDSRWDITDLALLSDCVINKTCGDLTNPAVADVNRDGSYGILDIVFLVRCILFSNCCLGCGSING